MVCIFGHSSASKNVLRSLFAKLVMHRDKSVFIWPVKMQPKWRIELGLFNFTAALSLLSSLNWRASTVTATDAAQSKEIIA
jgi:hypothetical protein